MEYYETLVGDGITKTFYFTFPFFGVNDIHVKIDGVEQSTDTYTMTPNPTPNDADTEYTGGRIEFTTAPANGAIVTIYREIDLTRHVDYQPTEKPLSYQLNQDANQLMGALRELDIKLKNTLDLATIPTLADLLSEIQTISTSLDTFLTADDLTDINTAVATIPDKATKDMDNITVTGKGNIISTLMPDYSTGTQVIFNGINSFTAPYDCFVSIQLGLKGGAQDLLYIDNVRFGLAEGQGTGFTRSTFCIYMKKDQTITGIVANDGNRDSCLYYFKLNSEL